MPADSGFDCEGRKGKSFHGDWNAAWPCRGLRRYSGGPLNTVTPCAACKLLRRRCTQECPFFPYFSPEEPHKFASVHKVFGASNVSKMLKDVPEIIRGEAAESLVYEANVRRRDPVYGCIGKICSLKNQLEVSQAQLDAVRAEISKYKNGGDTNIQPTSPYITVVSSTTSIGRDNLPLPHTSSLSDAFF